uniref:Uncharacterized protein n=1 Tax=Medicago truncatula TaxID=3880 RepID=I3SK79_MEDTR|nr:unknown [Medicago truncatula]
MTNVWSEIDLPFSVNHASVAKTTPRPVAASLPKEPPRSIGFPVTTAGECP